MKLEHQVCSLDLAKKLKELGVLQGGAFDYYENSLNAEQPFIVLRPTVNVMEQSPNWICSAFTVAELGEMLPSGTPSERSVLALEMWNYGDPKTHCVQYRRVDENGADVIPFEAFCDTNEANARAKMLIHLLTHNVGEI